MTNKILLIGGAAVLALAVPAIAQMNKPDQPSQTRAQAEAKVREHFTKLDVNKDGFVASDEMKLRMTAMHQESNDQHWARLDTDKNGSISRQEFDVAHGPKAGMATHSMKGEKGDGAHSEKQVGMRHSGGHGGKGMRQMMMMHMADTDKDGRVSQKEAIDGSLAMFDRADANKDGTLTQEERRSARQAMRQAWRAKAGS